MKLNLFDFIALGVSALGAILMGVSNIRHASKSAIETVETAFSAAEETDEVDIVDF